jgi:hypothetical protein
VQAPNAAVFVMRNGQPVRVPIQTGISDGTDTLVVSGLNAGDQVVTGVSTGSSSTAAANRTGNIFGFGGPGGGGNNRGGAGAGAGAGAQNRPGAGGGGAPAGGPPAGGAPAGGAPAGGPNP